MTVSRHLGFYRVGNSAIRSAFLENPSLEPNMEWIGCTFARYSPLNYTVTLKLGFGVTEGHRKRHYSIEHIRLCIRLLYSKCASICYRFRDIAAYWSNIASPLYLAPPLGMKPLNLRKKPWSRKTRMMGLSESERISIICSAV